MKKVIVCFSVILVALTLFIACKKKCAECPEGTTLSVDEPKEKTCICCPNGQTYNDAKGYCE